MALADQAQRAFAGLLGATTLVAGLWLSSMMFSGFARHRKVRTSFCGTNYTHAPCAFVSSLCFRFFNTPFDAD